MAKKRVARLNEQMKRELITLLRTDVRDPRVAGVNITDVEVSPDLYHAKVFFSVMGEAEDRQQGLEGLRAAAGFLRGEIGRRMHIRRAPELHFVIDDTLQHAMHIERLLQEARASSMGTVSELADPDDPECADDDADVGVHRDELDGAHADGENGDR
jgi:ribosome-binding factor A